MTFKISVKRIVDHYGNEAEERYTVVFSDSGSVQKVLLDLHEAKDGGEVLHIPEYEVFRNREMETNEVPDEILYSVKKKLKTAHSETVDMNEPSI